MKRIKAAIKNLLIRLLINEEFKKIQELQTQAIEVQNESQKILNELNFIKPEIRNKDLQSKLYKKEIELSEHLRSEAGVTEKYMVRQLINELIKNIPIEELNKLFKIYKYIPGTKEFHDRLNSPISIEERDLMMRLDMSRMGRYEASIKI